MTLRNTVALLAASTALTAAWGGTAVAQSSAGAPAQGQAAAEGSVGEIVVTAQRRAENLQKVPISVQAIQATQLANRGSISASDLTTLVPGLVLPTNIGSGTPFLRGNGNVTIVGGENGVAFYIDGVFLELPSSNLMSFNNIERVEVLKGPQGTLFGRNADAGLIQVITKDPSHATKLDAAIGYGSYNDINGNLFATTGLSPNVAASIAITGDDRLGGWGRNIGNGHEIFKGHSFAAQNKFLFTDDSKRFSLLTNVIYAQRRTNIGAVVGLIPGKIAPGNIVQNAGDYNVNNPAFDPYGHSAQTIVSVKAKYEFDWGTISDQVAYEKSHSFNAMNLTPLPTALSATASPLFYFLDSRDKTWTNELQLQSASNARLQWVLGGFYMWNRQDADNQVYGTFGGIGRNPLLTYKIDDGGNRITSYAAYAQATYAVLPSTHLTVGLRYSADQKDLFIVKTLYNAAGAVTAVQNQYTFANANPAVDASKSWSKLTERVSLDHQFTPDVMGYVAFNTGFKGGQFSTLNPNNPAAAPETVSAYTAGFKSVLFDRRVRFNVELFYNDYKNLQLKTVLSPTSTAPFVYNAGSGVSKGVDVDFEAVLGGGFTLSGGMEYLDAHYTKFVGAPCFHELPTGGIGPLGTGVCDLSGSRMIRSPELTFNAALKYDWILAHDAKITFQVADGYNSGFFWDPDHLVEQKAYHNVSASATWVSPDRRYQFSLWGKNISGSHIYASAQEATPYESYYPGEPATYGATFSLHY